MSGPLFSSEGQVRDLNQHPSKILGLEVSDHLNSRAQELPASLPPGHLLILISYSLRLFARNKTNTPHRTWKNSHKSSTTFVWFLGQLPPGVCSAKPEIQFFIGLNLFLPSLWQGFRSVCQSFFLRKHAYLSDKTCRCKAEGHWYQRIHITSLKSHLGSSYNDHL